MRMKRVLSLVISLVMTISAFSGLAITSASAEVGDAANNIWTASAADAEKNEGDILVDNDKATLYTVFKPIHYASTTDSSDVETPVNETVGTRTFNAFISTTDQNGGWDNSTGSVRVGNYKGLLKLVPKADGVVTVYCLSVGDTKHVCILKDGTTNFKTSGVEGGSIVYTKGTGSMSASAELKANETYYMFVDGSKGRFAAVDYEVGASYEQPTAVPETPKPPVQHDPNALSWTATAADNGIEANTLLMKGLTTLFKDTKNGSKYISCDADFNEATETGSGLKFVAFADGTLTVKFDGIGQGKTVYIKEAGAAAEEYIASYMIPTDAPSKESPELSAQVESGKTYYIAGKGTKARFASASFTAAAPVETDEPSDNSITYADGTVTVKADDNAVTSGVLIIATYDGEVLANIKEEELTFTNGVATKAVAISNGARLFVWDSLKGMKPLCAPYTVGGSSVTPNPTDEPESDVVVFRADDKRVAAMTTAAVDNGKGGTKTVISPTQTMGVWTVHEGWQRKTTSVNYTHTDGTEYTFKGSLYEGSGNTEARSVSFTPTASCKVTVVFDGTAGNANREMYIVQNGIKKATGKSVADGITAFSAEITDITAPVYVYGGGSNKNLYAVIVEYMEPEVQASYAKAWDFQQVNYGKAEAVADGLVCNDNTSDQKNDGTNGKGFLTGAQGGEIKVPIEPATLDENKVGVVRVTYTWNANFDMESAKTYEQIQEGDHTADYIYDASCVNDGFVTINTKGETYIKKIERTTLFKAPVTGTITSQSTKNLEGKNIVFTDKASGNTVKVVYGDTYEAPLINGRDYEISVEDMTDVCPTLATMNFLANVKKTEFNIELMDIADTAVTGEIVGLDNLSGVTLTFTNAKNAEDAVNATVTAATEADTKNLNPVTGTLSATLMPNNTYNITASGLPDGYSLSPMSQSYLLKAGDTKPFKNILFVKETPVVDYTTLTDGTINVGPHGDYKTINEALDVVRKMTNRGNDRVTLNLEAGATFTEQVKVDVNNVTLKSDPDNKATIQWYYGVGYLYYSAKNGYYDRDSAVQKTSKNNVTNWGCSVYVTGRNFLAENINFDATLNQRVLDAEIADGVQPAKAGSAQYSDGKADCPDRTADGFDPKAKASTERAAAMDVRGENAEFYNCKLQSSQDTLHTGSSAAYFKECDIYGMTDYIFGGNSVLFEQCNLIWQGYSTEDKNGPIGGYLTACSCGSDNGYVFKNCTVAKNTDPAMKSSPGTWGRNWGGAGCAVYFIDTTIADGAAKPVGWTKMSSNALSEGKLYVKGVYVASDTEKTNDLTVTTGEPDSKGNTANDNPCGQLTEAPADMTILKNWVPKHYEGARPEFANYTSIWEFGNTSLKGGAILDKSYEGVTHDFTSNTYLGSEAAADKGVTMKIDATTGKVNPGNASNGQFNPGTKLIIPVVDGSVLTVKGYSGLEFKINDTPYTTTGTYTHSGAAGTVTVESTGGMTYMEYVTLEWPKTGETPAIPTPTPTAEPTEFETVVITANQMDKIGGANLITNQVPKEPTAAYTDEYKAVFGENFVNAGVDKYGYLSGSAYVEKEVNFCEAGKYKVYVLASYKRNANKISVSNGTDSLFDAVVEGSADVGTNGQGLNIYEAEVTVATAGKYTVKWYSEGDCSDFVAMGIVKQENAPVGFTTIVVTANDMTAVGNDNGTPFKMDATPREATSAYTDEYKAIFGNNFENAGTAKYGYLGNTSRGHVEKEINFSEAGKYKVYVMASYKRTTNKISVSNGTDSLFDAVVQGSEEVGTNDQGLNIYEAEVTVTTAGKYTVKWYSEGDCSDFVAMGIVKQDGTVEPTPDPTETPSPSQKDVTVSGTVTITGMYNNNGSKRDGYKMKASDLVLKLTPSEGEAVTATVTGTQGDAENALSYTATVKSGTAYTLSLADNDNNNYIVSEGASVTPAENTTNNISAAKTYTYKVPIEFDANSYSQLSDSATYTVTFNTRNSYSPTSITFKKADIDAETRLITATGHGFKPVDTNGEGNNYFIAHLDTTTIHASASAQDGYEQNLSTDTTVNPSVSFGKISVTLPSAPTGVTISGTVEALETLTATLAPADAAATYQWYTAEAADSAEATWVAIEGATNASLQLTNDMKDKYIAVKATGTGLAGTASAITETAVTGSNITSYTYKFAVDQTEASAPSYSTNTNLLANTEENVNNVDKAVSMVLVAKDGATSCAAVAKKVNDTTYSKWRIATRGTTDFQNLTDTVDTSAEGFTWGSYSNSSTNPVIVVTPKVNGTFKIVIGQRASANSTFYMWDNESKTMTKETGTNEIKTLTLTMTKGHTYVMGHTGTGDGAVYEASFTTLENLPE